MRRAIVLFAVTFLMIMGVPANAVNWGTPDHVHDNVGAIVVDIDWVGDGSYNLEFFCSGSLISDDHFLTAGHCVYFMELFDIRSTWVSFDQDLNGDPETWIVDPEHLVPVTDQEIAPGFEIGSVGPGSTRNDLAVLTLGSDPGVEPVELPTAGFLAEQAAGGGLIGHSFVYSGYGANAHWLPGAHGGAPGRPGVVSWNAERNTATAPFASLTPRWLSLMAKHALTGEGGICGGDSGSAQFFAADGVYENTIVSVTYGINAPCDIAKNINTRLDTPMARAFLGRFVDLP